MTDQELDGLAFKLPFIKAWIEAVEIELMARLESGVEFKNVTLVPKRANRNWVEGVDMISVLQPLGPIDKIAPRVVLSPAKVEKEFGKASLRAFSEYVVKESSGVNLSYVPPRIIGT